MEFKLRATTYAFGLAFDAFDFIDFFLKLQHLNQLNLAISDRIKELGKMFDEHKAKIYIGLSFTFGILLTLGFKDAYPDLERRYRQNRRRGSTWGNPFGRSSQKITLQDQESNPTVTGLPELEIPEGIESAIGNTPLFRIKSLSDATGCEILGKAEVGSSFKLVVYRDWMERGFAQIIYLWSKYLSFHIFLTSIRKIIRNL
jgi:hypothetical protein